MKSNFALLSGAATLALSAAMAVLAVPSAAAPSPQTVTLAPTVVPAPRVQNIALHGTTSNRSFESGVVRLRASGVVSVSWAAPSASRTSVVVQVLEGGRWGKAQTLSVISVKRGKSARWSSDALLTHAATAVKVRIMSTSSVSSVRLLALNAPPAASDLRSVQISRSTARPAYFTRAQWGADETRRTGAATFTSALRVGILHHTAGWSTYSATEAFSFIRALYDWSTTPVAQGGPGYSDIPYNVLVDRFGRIYEGRAGGFDRPVLGDHTDGFNAGTFGVAVMGDYDLNPLPTASADAVVTSIAKVMAWKLAPYHRNPFGTDRLVSTSGAGTSKFPVGATATVPVIAAHSDFAHTACPGRNLTSQMALIRRKAAAFMNYTVALPAPSFGSPTAASVAYLATPGANVVGVTTRPLRWTATVTSPCVSGPVRVITGTQTAAGRLAVNWDLRDSIGIPVSPGQFTVALSGVATDGTKPAAPPVTVSLNVTPSGTAPAGPCASVSRAVGSDAIDSSIAIGRWVEPTAASAVLVPSDTTLDLTLAQIAAPLARQLRLPVLGVHQTSVPAAVLEDLKARHATSVILVATSSGVRPGVETQLHAAGIATKRISGLDLATVAANVARLMNVSGTHGAVYFIPGQHESASALAAAAAARTGRPLLIVTPRLVPAVTQRVVADQHISGGALVAPLRVVPAQLVRSLGAVRVWSDDPVALSLALAPATTSAGDRAVLVARGSVVEASFAASAGRPVLQVAPQAVPSSVLTWLTQRTEVNQVGAALPQSVLPDSALVSLSKSMALRPPPPLGFGLRTMSGIAKRGASAPIPVPSSFVIQGSGWGHGIGLSQAGAYGQAREGRTGEQIVSHYYTGTTVASVDDAMELAVALHDRVQAVSMRPEQMDPNGSIVGRVRVSLAGGPTVVGDALDRFVFTYRAGVVVVTRTHAGVGVVVGRASSVHVTWAGTRAASANGLSAAPTLMNVAGPGESFRDKQHRYRFGSIDVRPIGRSSYGGVGLMVINNVRLHDEYLYGIAEVDAAWPIQALRAQILASRSYAYAQWKHGLRSSCLCHSDDGGGPFYDQTFLGWVKTDEGSYSPAWRHAVDTTLTGASTGEAIEYHGQVIEAFYTDSTGGRTQNNEDVWGDAPLAWARSVDDHWSLDPLNSPSFAHWRPRTRTQSQLATAFGLPDVVSVTISKRLASGTAREITATSSTGVKATLSGARFRSRMSLPSQWIWSVTAAA